MDCQTVATEELKRLRDIQRLLQLIALTITNQAYINSIGLEEVL